MADAPLPVPQDHSDPEPHVLTALNERQREFCKHYVMTKGNATKSALLAGYAVANGHHAHAQRLLAMPHVQEGVAYYRELFSAQLNYDREKVLYDLAVMAAVDVSEFVDDEWQPVRKSQLSEEHRRALVGLEVIRKQETTTIKPKYARLEALREIAGILGIKERDKGTGQGLSLQISLGQSVHVDGATVAQQVGHVQIHTHEDTPAAKDET
jgi:hypothetical protein